MQLLYSAINSNKHRSRTDSKSSRFSDGVLSVTIGNQTQGTIRNPFVAQRLRDLSEIAAGAS